MAIRIVWTQTASSDLQAIVRYITSDNPDAARHIAERILDQIEGAAGFPLSGRVVPEKQDDSMREKILNPYRIVYTVDETDSAIHVVRIWHAARGEPEIDSAQPLAGGDSASRNTTARRSPLTGEDSGRLHDISEF